MAGGEERGTWLRDVGAASDETFAFALTLTTEPDGGAIGTLTRDAASAEAAALSLREFAGAIAQREPLRFGSPGSGFYILTWA